MAKRGRPKLSEEDKRSIVRIIVFNKQEDQNLRSLAKSLNASMGASIRYAVSLANELEKDGVSRISIKDYS